MTAYRILAGVLAMAVLSGPANMAKAQPYQEFTDMANPNLQYSPNSLRGGIGFQMPPQNQTIFSGGAQIGSVCGFDFGFNMTQQIMDLVQSIPALAAPLLISTAVTIICQRFPGACDTFKHIHGFANVTLRAQRQACQQIMQVAHLDGIRARGPAQAKCVERVLGQTRSINSAIEDCDSIDNLGPLPSVNGIVGNAIDSFENLFDSSGVNPVIAQSILSRLPKFTASATGNFFSQQNTATANQSKINIAQETESLTERINLAVDVVRTGGVPVPIDVPGQPLPVWVYDTLGGMSEEERTHRIALLASAMATEKEYIDITEEAEALQKAMSVATMSGAQREPMQAAFDGLMRERDNLVSRHEVANRLLMPQIAALQSIKAEQEARANQAALGARSSESRTAHFGESAQTPMGYRQ